MLLTARNLAKSFGPRLLFSGITLGLDAGERVGLIGPNGSGKSTLLKILANTETADEGELITRRGLRVGYVQQEEAFDADRPCVDIVSANADSHLAAHDRRLAASVMLGRVGFDDPDVLAGALSGGWRKRLSIAKQLVTDPELLLMDEPTNHLDLEGVLWLEKLVGRGQFATLIVTHDRRFLENVASRIVELDRRYPDGYLSHDGAYSGFLEKRDAFLAAQQGRQQSLASGVRREIEWLQRGAKARTTKAKGRIERAQVMQSELADLRTRNTVVGPAGIDFAGSGRKTKKLIELVNVARRFGDRTLFENVNLTLSPGDRLGLIGSNGTGKTTLIRLLSGENQPDAGVVNRAAGLQVIVFDQHREQLDLDQTLRRALFPSGDTLEVHGNPTHVAGWAKRFLFRGEQLDVPVRDLSGGERARVLVARLMLREADVLILDEPTNDLDIPTLDVLEASIESFAGAVVLVTHDRYLLDRATTSLLALDGRGNADDYASLAQWERARAARQRSDADTRRAATPTPARPPTTAPSPAIRKRLTWAEQRELEGIEEAILAAEARVEQLQTDTADPAIAADHVRSADLYQRLSDAQQVVDRLYARWGALEERSA